MFSFDSHAPIRFRPASGRLPDGQPRAQRRGGARRWLSASVAVSVAASLVVAMALPARAAEPEPSGGSRFRPLQSYGSAVGREHAADATQTAAANSTPAGDPVLPPAAKGVVGREIVAPEPAGSIEQCRPCPPGTKPTVPPRGAATTATEEGKATLTPGAGSKGYVEGVSRELTETRTATSTTYANPDGTKTLRIHSGPEYALNRSGQMVPTDTRLERDANGRFRPAAAAAVSFGLLSTDPDLATMHLSGGLEVGFAIADATAVAGVPAGADLRFHGIRPHADLVLSATATGVRESIVLESAATPTVWRFPLRLKGLTPELTAGRTIEVRDAAGTLRAVIPPGFMYDSVPDPRTGTGTRSNGVSYTLLRDGDAWVLQLSLDATWLRSPARRFPVVVDPPLALRDTTFVDTFVSSRDFANRDNSAETFLKVGTYNGGVDKAAAYVRFFGLETFHKRFIHGASLNLYQTWARSCTASPLYVYRVTGDWWEREALGWPGPAYDAANMVASKSFARGGNCTSRPAGWESIPIDPVRFTKWLDGRERWYGFSLRASSTDNNGEKFFHSSEYTGGGAPFVDILYSDEGATYSLPSPRFDPPVTPSTWGFLDVDVTNLGVSTWYDWPYTTGIFNLYGYIRNSAGSLVQTSVHGVGEIPVPHGGRPRLAVVAGPLPAGTYTITITMRDQTNGRDFDTYYGVPHATVSFTVLPEATPEVVSYYPPNNAQVDRLRPALWAQYHDADNAPGGPYYWFRVCNGTEAAPVGCQDSQWITSASWTVPAGVLSWGTTSFWYVAVYDGQNMSYLTGPYYMTPVVAQPEITHHLAGAPDGADVPGLNVQVGNYSTDGVDASVPVAGPPLEIRRTYNSQDPRSSGAFGAGWSTPLDQRITTDADGSGNVVVTLASGRQVRFGKNADGSFAPPPGHNLRLVRGTGSWTLRDATGQRRVFDDAGKLTTVIDSYGRQQQLTYASGLVSQVKDVASGRSLYLTWAGGRVTTVKTDAPSVGGAQPTWSYSYTGSQLTRVCSPLSAQSCTDYQYTSSSHYRSVVIDDNPTAYWTLSETSGGTANNVVARKPGEHAAAYAGVALGKAGALAGSSDTAVQFGASATSGMTLPLNLTNTSLSLAVEVWFKATSGQRGVLYAYQDTDLSRAPGGHAPALYVDTGGRLRGYYWTPSGSQMISTGRVDDGLWHHAVLAGAVDRQELYLDGVRIGQITTAPIAFLAMRYAYIGNGSTAGWPAAVSGNFPFTGQIDEVAFYRHPLSAVQVSSHYAARAATSRLVKTIEPGSFTAMQAAYDGSSGRVSTVQDRHGAVWTVSQPALGQGTRAVTVSSSGRDSIAYTFDAMRGGRLTSRQTGAGTEKWEYDANGFITKYTDANNRSHHYFRDARGNITWETVFRSGAWVWKSYGYYFNSADKLDPRNDHLIWQSGTRNAWDNDPRNRIRYDLDATGRNTRITYPGAAGAPTIPVESFVYTDGTEAAVGGGAVPAGLLEQSTNRLGGVTGFGYNSRGDLVRSTDPLGLLTTYGYDLMGRNTTRTTSAVVGGQTVVYGTWSTGYNAASLPVTETAPGITNPISGVTHTAVTTYTYDASGRVTQKTTSDSTGGDPSRTWTNTYDAAGRLRTTTMPDNAVTTQEWNTAGDLAKVTRSNGLVLEYQYDDTRHLTETVAVGAGVDPVDPNATRLVIESRAYDPAGQLASVVDAMGREKSFTYHNDGLVESVKRVRRDAQGEVTSTTVLARYEYDHGGNMIRVTEAGGVVRDYDYDDAGLRNRETLDAAGLARSNIYTFTSDGQVASKKQTNGFTFVTGRSSESPHLFAAGGSQIDGAGSRYADGTAVFTYRFVLPSNAATGMINLEIDNQYLVHLSSDNQNWTEVLRETRDIRDGSNRVQWFIGINSYLQNSKTVYLRVGDSQPTNGWGGAVSRVAVEYTRAGEQAAKTSHQYDTKGNLIRTTVDNTGGSPASLVTATSRDPRGLATQVTDPAGATTRLAYDSVGNSVTTTGQARTIWRDGVRTDGFEPVTTVGRNTFGEATHERDAHWATTLTQYEAMGRPTSITAPPYTPPGGTALTPVTTITYNVNGQPATVTDPLGQVTTTAYDKYGRTVSRTLPDPYGSGSLVAPQWRYAYDRVGEMLETTDPTGARSLATYNDLGHQITQSQTERVGTETFYFTSTLGRDDAGRLTTLTGPRNHTTTFQYNAAGQTVRVTDPVGRVAETRYDAIGRVTAEILAGTRATSYRYDPAGRRIAESDHTVVGGVLSAPLRTRQTGYDGLGRPLSVTSPEGRLTQYAYDAGGNLASVTQRTNPADQATAITVALGYDGEGRRTRTVDGNGNATDYLFNDWDLPTAAVEPATPGHPAAADRTWTTVYDAAGQAVRDLLPGGVSRTRTFDGLGRVTAETGAGTGSTTVGRGFDYDAADRLTRVSSPAGDYTYAWNDRGLLTQSTGPAGTSTFGYDAEGNLTTRTDPSGTGSFGYDNAGRIQTATDALSPRVATFSYTPTGEIAGISYGTDKPSRTMTYDNLGRLATDTVKQSDGATVLSTVYTSDRDGLITGRTTSGYAGGGSSTYGYDGLGRLTSWTRPDDSQIGYGYDAASNRVAVTGAAGPRTFTFDARNRLLGATGGGQPDLANAWSARGTLDIVTANDANVTYHNDAFDKPVLVEGSSYSITYTYDALDRLAQRNGIALAYPDLTNNPARVPTAWGDALIFRAPDGTPLSDKYGTDPGRLLVTDRARGDSVGAVGNLTGMLLASRSYAPYGEVTATSGRFSTGFQGDWTDPDTGQVNAHARWYDPGQATFTSRDSWTLNPDTVVSVNRYAYGNASPITYADPTGHCAPACALPLAAFGGPIVWGVVLGLVVLGSAAYAYDSYQGSCYASGTCSSGGSGSTQNPYMAPELAEVRSLVNAVGSSNLLEEIYRMAANGATASALISYIQLHYGSHPAVQQYTAAHRPATATTTTTTAVTTTPPPAIPWTPPAALPPPPVGQTITNVIPPEVALLPAGQQLVNSVEAAVTLTVPTILQTNADGSDAANAAVVSAAAALATTASPNNDDDDRCDWGPTHRDLRGRGQGDSHHIVQDAAVRDLKGYSRNDAPTVPLQGPSTSRGNPHYGATQRQRQFGGGTYAAEREIAFQALRAAGYTAELALEAIERADRYFKGKLGVCDDTPTRIPGDRRRS